MPFVITINSLKGALGAPSVLRFELSRLWCFCSDYFGAGLVRAPLLSDDDEFVHRA